MRINEVAIGKIYSAKVNGNLTHLRVVEKVKRPRKGCQTRFVCENLGTGREVCVTAGKLRRAIPENAVPPVPIKPKPIIPQRTKGSESPTWLIIFSHEGRQLQSITTRLTEERARDVVDFLQQHCMIDVTLKERK